MEKSRKYEQQRTAADAADDGREVAEVVSAQNGDKSAKYTNDEPEGNSELRGEIAFALVLKGCFEYFKCGKELYGH